MKEHCHIRPRGDKSGWAIDTYGGNGCWNASCYADTKEKANKKARRIRYFIKKHGKSK